MVVPLGIFTRSAACLIGEINPHVPRSKYGILPYKWLIYENSLAGWSEGAHSSTDKSVCRHR